MSILVISKHNSFRVLFDKKFFRIFYLKKYIYILASEITSVVNIVVVLMLLGEFVAMAAVRFGDHVTCPRWSCPCGLNIFRPATGTAFVFPTISGVVVLGSWFRSCKNGLVYITDFTGPRRATTLQTR